MAFGEEVLLQIAKRIVWSGFTGFALMSCSKLSISLAFLNAISIHELVAIFQLPHRKTCVLVSAPSSLPKV